jgi:branched-chain amino acid transport system permease protein
MDYTLFILAVFALYAAMAVSLNLVVGYAGMLSLTHAAFVGVGAYGVAILTTRTDTPWVVALVLAVVIAAALALALGVVTLPVTDIYYVVASFALQVILFNVLLNWKSLTGGALGLPAIPKPTVAGQQITNGLPYLIFAVVLASIVIGLVWRLVSSPYGRVLKAIREDETAAMVLGKRVARVKVVTFAISSAMAGACGAALAPLLGFINPGSFAVDQTVYLLALVIIGGTGNVLGSIVGAAVLVGLPELLSFMNVGGNDAPQVRQIIYGLVLVACIRWLPLGIVPEHATWRRRKRVAARREPVQPAEMVNH